MCIPFLFVLQTNSIKNGGMGSLVVDFQLDLNDTLTSQEAETLAVSVSTALELLLLPTSSLVDALHCLDIISCIYQKKGHFALVS